MYKFFLFLTFVVGTLIHIYFLQMNEVLKVADSFAYLQMSNYFNELSLNGFGNGWFGFLYSLPIAGINSFIDNNFLSAQILNLILFNFSGFLLYKIGKKYLTKKYLIILVLLFFLSPILLHFNIAILSENIYLSLFLFTVLGLLNFIEEPRISDGIAFGFLIALMYFTRGEAFIYLISIGLVSLFIFFRKKTGFNFRKIISFNVLLILFFGIFVFPYVFYLHSFTGEWGLSNKGSSNLRQAIMRGKEKMDDDGFEKAVAELTPDSKHLISGFAGGLKYDKPTTGITLKKYILEDRTKFLNNWISNQKKLYSKNLPQVILGDGGKLYFNSDSSFFYKNKIFLISLLLILILFVIGLINLYKNKKRDILIILFSFFFIASVFFTLFFTLNRYFIIFIPLFILVILYGIQTIDKIYTFSWTGFTKKTLDKNKISGHKILKIILILNFITIYFIGLLSYYNSHKFDDDKYLIKKEAGIWLNNNSFKIYKKEICGEFKVCKVKMSEKKYLSNLNILERFPIVTYYSGTNNRFITPYSDSINNILTYARFNKIDYLIVDSLDFEKYRPNLKFLLEEKKKIFGLKMIKKFEQDFEGRKQKVLIYKIK